MIRQEKDKDGNDLSKDKIDLLEKWLKCSGTPKKEDTPTKPATINITADLLSEVFGNKDIKRLEEVAKTINKYSDDFKINTPLRMSHFLAQIGHETNGLKKLSEDYCYRKTSIKDNFGRAFYCDLFVGYESNLNTCGNGHPAPCTPNLSKYLSNLQIKDKYICSEIFLDYVYSCRMGNGNPLSKDGSKYMGKGFIHLTGRDEYIRVTKEWNKKYPNDKKDFVDNDNDRLSLSTDIETAMKASLIYWEYKEINTLADNDSVKLVTEKVNGGGNGFPERNQNTKQFKEKIK